MTNEELEEFQRDVEREAARGTMEVAGDNDRAWFAANHNRHYRLRAPLPGEHFYWKGDVTRTSCVLVLLRAPGLRVKTFGTLAQALVNYPDDEATAEMLWKEMCKLASAKLTGSADGSGRLPPA